MMDYKELLVRLDSLAIAMVEYSLKGSATVEDAAAAIRELLARDAERTQVMTESREQQALRIAQECNMALILENNDITEADIIDYSRRLEAEIVERCAKVCEQIERDNRRFAQSAENQAGFASYHRKANGAASCVAAIRALIEPEQKAGAPLIAGSKSQMARLKTQAPEREVVLAKEFAGRQVTDGERLTVERHNPVPASPANLEPVAWQVDDGTVYAVNAKEIPVAVALDLLAGPASNWMPLYALPPGSVVVPDGPPAALTHDCPTPDLCVCESVEISCLPPLTDAMYHAVRGLELEFGRGADGFVGTLNDDALDEIWEAINTALRVQP